jgi:hypothetical protein
MDPINLKNGFRKIIGGKYGSGSGKKSNYKLTWQIEKVQTCFKIFGKI